MSIGARRAMLTGKIPVYTEVVVTLSGSGTHPLPSNYVASLGVRWEAVGGSSGSRGGASGSNGGGGVGGAAAAWGTDFSPAAGDNVPYQVGQAGSGSAFNTASGLTDGTDTWWNDPTIAKADHSRQSGAPSVGAAGLAANSVGTNTTSGSAGTAGNTGASGRGGSGGAAASTPNITGGAGGTPGMGTTVGQNGSANGGGRGGFPGGGPGGGRNLTGGAGADGQPGTLRIAYTVVT